MDKSVLTRVNVFTNEIGFLASRGAGKVPPKTKIIIELLKRPWDLIEKPNRLKDLLFPDEHIPPEIDKSTLMENLQILIRPEGVAIVLSDKLLFRPGSAKLLDPAKKILTPVIDVLHYMNADVNISGHTDSTFDPRIDNYSLSGSRAISVLDYFLDRGLIEHRLSISGYGPEIPLESNETPHGRQANRRVEILVKTAPTYGGFVS